ncbi:MAG: hypothetical protein ACHQK9_02535 [Reyranellales bacterium]
MSERSIHRAPAVLATLALVVSLGACNPSPNPAWTASGWYLEQPRLLLVSGPVIFSGPFSYDQCEAERMKATTPDSMYCMNEKVAPGPTGPY